MGPITFAVFLTKGVRVIAAGPGKHGPESRLAAESQGVLEVGCCLVKVAHGLWQEAQDAVDSKARAARAKIALGSHGPTIGCSAPYNSLAAITSRRCTAINARARPSPFSGSMAKTA